MKQILAAVDFSDLATCVLEHAASQALAFGGRVHIIHVETPVAAFIGNEIGPQLPPPEQHLEETLQQGLGESVAGGGAVGAADGVDRLVAVPRRGAIV